MSCFNDDEIYKRALKAPSLAPEAIAPLYGLAPEVQVIAYPPAIAMKIVMDRKLVAGDPGDRDVYGALVHPG